MSSGSYKFELNGGADLNPDEKSQIDVMDKQDLDGSSVTKVRTNS